ncbi:hypothetical protein OIE68_25385 [Nocardia vinacea]|uniref:hypothetical protein n=1 Tax=Nocardia vinacea TaxID=96468 RepID=UPI002E0F34C1|nr:hypothetical protein OIE68_25385 [Nocardia vinacea]
MSVTFDKAPDRTYGTHENLPLGPAIIAVLVLDALIALALEVLYLPTYINTIAFPLSAVLAGVVNVLLVMGVRSITHRVSAMFLPVAAWTLGFLTCSVTGPGGDIMLGSDWRTLLLLFCGLVPPLLYIYIRSNAGLFSSH